MEKIRKAIAFISKDNEIKHTLLAGGYIALDQGTQAAFNEARAVYFKTQEQLSDAFQIFLLHGKSFTQGGLYVLCFYHTLKVINEKSRIGLKSICTFVLTSSAVMEAFAAISRHTSFDGKDMLGYTLGVTAAFLAYKTTGLDKKFSLEAVPAPTPTAP